MQKVPETGLTIKTNVIALVTNAATRHDRLSNHKYRAANRFTANTI